MGAFFGFSGISKAFASERGSRRGGKGPARIALIVDDIGFSPSRAHRFLDIGVPITFAVLPRVPYSHALAREIHEAGHEIMLHQPMEPFNPEVDPGPGALFVGDGADKIARVMEENISEIPFATGVNNHMGSRFTSSEKEMEEALAVIKEKNLFFVDSLTTSRSTGYETARRLHMAAACRNIFLDTRLDESAIFAQLERLARRALSRGAAIGIGHPFPETARAVGRFVRNLRGIRLVYVSSLLPSPKPASPS
ncbi:MAG: divergent polysaccharide deacetylase family protein [Deltaproteobacteria bacterium]|nr:divergent polysaccharide deacetylase family protein [Deltaproteobacteria bacterium]MBW2128263.1 divergent polysaccharide deacetylase family protein [Deltaproteobacteria bacterium]